MIIRKANIYDTNDIARVHYDVWTDYHGDHVSAEFLEKLSLENRKKFWLKYINEGHIVYVIEEKTGGIIGFAVPKLNKKKTGNSYGEVVAHYVADKYQNQGFGSVLLVACAKLFVKNHMNTMQLWVNRDHPATEYYKRMGGLETDAKLDKLDTKDIIKLKMTWSDLQGFVSDHEYVFDNIIKEY